VSRYGWLVIVAWFGCWSEPTTIDGFNADQWAALQNQLRYTPPAPTAMGPSVQLASELFTDTSLTVHASDTCKVTPSPVSCKTCHDPRYGWSDPRTPNNVSQGALKYTARNAMTLFSVCSKRVRADGGPAFTWSGQYTSAGQVLELAIKKPFGWCSYSDGVAAIASLIRTNGNYLMLYASAYGPPGPPSPDADATVIQNLDKAFDDYFCTTPFITPTTDFDHWLAGEPSMLSDSAKRGFAVFVGRGTCIECHSGPLFSDLQFHNTGVPQVGDNVPAIDNGRGDLTAIPADTGKFLTGTLREIANTGPYMHDGAFETLADVIDFYRHGGVASGYSGTRDPRIAPLDLTDQDALDLEAFLRSLCADPTVCGVPVPPPMRDAGMPDAGMPPDASVPDVGPPDANVPDAFPCPPGFTMCGPMCIDTQNDPLNCGACGNVCTAPKLTCAMGSCVH
jgi:cytochrome c peroxidase